jgi:hypothetical protein
MIFIQLKISRTPNITQFGALVGQITPSDRIRRFVRDHALADIPHTSLWLPAGMYGSQIWSTVFLQAGREFSSSLSRLHLHFSEGHWCSHSLVPLTGLYSENVDMFMLQFYWYRSAVNLINSMLNTISVTLRRVVQAADLNLQPYSGACWTAQLLSAFQGLCGCESYV